MDRFGPVIVLWFVTLAGVGLSISERTTEMFARYSATDRICDPRSLENVMVDWRTEIAATIARTRATTKNTTSFGSAIVTHATRGGHARGRPQEVV